MSLSRKQISLDAPNVGEREVSYLKKAIDEGFVSTFGPYITQFEEKIRVLTGAEAALSTQSGTSALHLALLAIGVEPTDEVLVPAITFAATANAVRHAGAIPVLVDVDPTTWNISVDDLKRKITSKSKVILPVHLFGNPAPIEDIVVLAEQHGMYVVEDAAEALGSFVNGRHVGTIGLLGCLSFNGNKVITTGGGGMVLGPKALISRLSSLSNQGREPENTSNHKEVGFNYRMTNIEAALGLAQFEQLEAFLEKKRLFHSIYKSHFQNDARVSFQFEIDGVESSYWMTCMQFSNNISVVSIAAELEKCGIPTRRIFRPLVDFPPFAAERKDFPNACSLYESVLCLPSSTLNDYDAIEYVCKKIAQVLDSNAR